jgi:hypothetical protein
MSARRECSQLLKESPIPVAFEQADIAVVASSSDSSKSSINLIVRQIFRRCVPEGYLRAIWLEYPEMSAEFNESRSFVGQLKFDATHRASVFAAPIHIIVNGNLDKGRSLITRQLTC